MSLKDNFIPLSKEEKVVDIETESTITVSSGDDSSSEEDDIDICLKGISDMRAVMEIIINQITKQQATLDKLVEQQESELQPSLDKALGQQEQLLARVQGLEDVTKKQQKCLRYMKKHYTQEKGNDHQKKPERKNPVSEHKSPLQQQANEQPRVQANHVPQQVAMSRFSPVKAKRLQDSKLSRARKLLTSSKSKARKQAVSKNKEVASTDILTCKVAPRARKIVYKRKPMALYSSKIDRESLSSIEEVLHKYKDYIDEGKVSCLALRLAEEAVFGKDILAKCTPKGRSLNYPALPIDSLNTVKQTLFQVFPQYWKDPDQFEEVWSCCEKRIERHCSKLRTKSGTILPRVESSHQELSLPEPIHNEEDESKSISVPESNQRLNQSVSNPPVHEPPSASAVMVYNALPSSEINRQGLISVEKFLGDHGGAIREGKYSVSALCRKLAMEVMFGEEVLARCTPLGKGFLPGLPKAEFNLLKQTLLDCFPEYWDNLPGFEARWQDCRKSLNSMCSKLRHPGS